MIYTTYFAQLRNLPENIFPVSICAKAPVWYKGAQYKKLAPLYGILMKYKEDHDAEYYTKHFYAEVLDKLSVATVLNDLQLKLPENMQAKTDPPIWQNDNLHIALVCFEKPSDFCHRHIVAEWLNSHNIKCQEWQKR